MIFIKLLLAHLLGDFLLQPNSWVRQKEKLKLKAPSLYVHCLIHAALSWLLVFKVTFWPYAVVLFLIHLAIDAGKITLQKKHTKHRWFFIDQGLHILSLVVIWYWFVPDKIAINQETLQTLLLIGTLGFALSIPTSILVKVAISPWAPETHKGESDSLQNAGKYIGIMERLLVYIMVLTGNISAVGFLLAAKSVFRFGDLRQAHDRKLTEYILIGTLLSFGIALALGLISSALL